jgi:GNAT superfamily N-acetyltransferase
MTQLDIHPIAAADTHWLRHVLLRPHQAPDTLIYPGDEAPDSLHVGAFRDGQLVGIASISRQPFPGAPDQAAWQLRGMATLPEVRRQGYGAALVRACLDHVAAHGAGILWCNGRTTAISFYQAQDFRVWGEEFEVPGTGPHYVLWQKVEPLDMDIQFRSVRADELEALLELYTHLNPTDAPWPDEATLQQVWHDFLADPKVRCLVGEVDNRLVASCTLVIIPNLTRGTRPYGLIENVVTHADYRQKGFGTRLLRHALQLAWEQNCYKVMLLSGRKEEETLRFYERAGFHRGIKTGFVAKPEE